MAIKRREDIEQQNRLLEKEFTKEKLDLYNERTLFWENDEKKIYFFDYGKDGTGRSEIVNRHVLKRLKDRNLWRIIRHPLVMNWVNEKILGCAYIYTLQIVMYFVFLFLLYFYSLGSEVSYNIVLDLVVTAIVLVFIFFLVVKAALKVQDLNTPTAGRLSIWFLISYAFNGLTYFITLIYIWGIYQNTFDNYHQELRRALHWLLPILAVVSSWVNCLYILRKSPFGDYILMMSKILSTFAHTMLIWIPTLFCFAFAFQTVMRGSGTAPWDDPDFRKNSSVWMLMFRSFTKTSAMMVGEVEANDILERKAWIANLLLIVFEIITVILLMNLMISLAVGDVNDLRNIAEEKRLKIKVNFCIEALHLSEQITCLERIGMKILHRRPTNNLLVIYKNEHRVFTRLIHGKGRFFTNQHAATESTLSEKVYNIVPNTTGLRLRNDQLSNQITMAALQNCTFRLVEVITPGIRRMNDPEFSRELEEMHDNEGACRKYQRWLIGLEWKTLLVT